MLDSRLMPEPTMSMRVLQPFIKAVRQRGIDPRVLRFLEQRDLDARIQANAAIELLRISVRITQDEGLGLAAALETSPGDYGALEYAAASCSTVREGLAFVCRHYFLLDESTTLDYSSAHGQVRICVRQNSEFATRAGADFVLSMLHLSYLRWADDRPLEYEIQFAYPQPPDLSVHETTFGPHTRLSFGADSNTALFREIDLEQPLRYSDPKLHALLAAHLRDRTPETFEPSLIGRVRASIREELRAGTVSIEAVASRMAMSRRNLSRKLEEEGTSFKQLLRDLRRACAVRYLLLDYYSIEQISKRLGYADPGAFHRAFRSWFGQTPTEYREQQRRA
jgi:AraC-like DNA-binding protein